jgi:hypothetical protein
MDASEAMIESLQEFLPLTEENLDPFLRRVAALTEDGNRRAVRPVLMLVDERCPLSGAMQRMLDLLESVPVADYVAELLETLPEFNAKSPFYAESELKKLLWSAQDRLVLKNAAKRVSREQSVALRAVLDRIDAPALIDAVAEVKKAVPDELRDDS